MLKVNFPSRVSPGFLKPLGKTVILSGQSCFHIEQPSQIIDPFPHFEKFFFRVQHPYGLEHVGGMIEAISNIVTGDETPKSTVDVLLSFDQFGFSFRRKGIKGIFVIHIRKSLLNNRPGSHVAAPPVGGGIG